MAEPTESYPETATNRARKNGADTEGDGQTAIEDALSKHGETLAAAINRSDELNNALETAILVIATADEDELDELTDAAVNLITAAEGLSTDEMAELATDLGENADTLSDSLELLVALQDDGHLDDLAALATAFIDSLSTEEIDRLSRMLAENGPELIAALEAVVELQQEDQLDALLDTATTLSALDIDDETVAGLNDVLGAVGDAHRVSKPTGLGGTLRALGSRELRASLGYLLTVLRALGRRLRLG